jgi:hypothetical protein
VLFRGLTAAAVILLGLSLLAGWAPGILIGLPAVLYLGSLLWAPKRKCASCKGAKVHGDVLGSAGVRRCWMCGGHGEYARWGTIVLRRDVHAQIRAGRHGRNW